MTQSNRLSTSFFSSSLLLVMSVLLASAQAQTNDKSISVDAMYAQQSPSNTTLNLTGTIEAKQHAQLAPLAAGRVAQIAVEIGDRVKKDQVLLSLNTTLAELEVEGAKASLNVQQVNEVEAQRLLAEAIALSKQQVVPQTLIAERRALVANAQAQLNQAQAQLSLQQEILDRHILRAPFDGVIVMRNIDIGEWIGQQSAAFTLVADNNVRLSVAIPQEYYTRLANKPDIIVHVFTHAGASEYTRATISRFVPVSDPISRSFIAQIDLSSSINLAVGMSARVEILVPNTLSSSITLPRAAIKQHPDGGSSVFVVENGKAKRIITPYTALADNMVSIPNQPSNVPYILTGIELLQDGTEVNVNIVLDIAKGRR